MTRVSLVTLLLLAAVGCAGEAQSGDQAKMPGIGGPAKPGASAGENPALVGSDQLKTFESDADPQKLVEFARQNLQAIDAVIRESPEQAKIQVDALRKAMSEVKTKGSEEAEAIVGQVNQALDLFAEQIKLQRTTLEGLKEEVTKSPDDVEGIKRYTMKLMMVLSQSMDDVKMIEAALKSEGEFIASTTEKATDSEAKLALKRAELMLRSMEGNVERLKAYDAVVGKEMLPIEADAWVNGKPITTEELQGKVVLFDFWAIWCGPCIASFPHLIEWQEKYGDQGFQVVGVTQYFDFTWPEGSERPQQSESGNADPKEEQAALTKLTKMYHLNYPTAVMKDSEDFYKYYAVSAIPHMVIVGRDGKVKKVNAGISEDIAKKLDVEIQELLKEPAPSK